jgi:glyoxylase-like metal-dependent hydrolase (beta-lactamase superfamily II)
MIKKSLLAFATVASFGAAPGHAGQLGVYQSDQSGFDTRTYWYDDGVEITVFDTQFVPALTEEMIKEIRKASDNPITRVIVTHPNPDKFNGLSVLHSLGATSIASKATAEAMPGVNSYKRYFWINVAKAFTEATYPAFEPVEQTFEGRLTINLASGETLTLFQLEHSGVSSTQTVVRIDATGDLIVGDLVHHNAHAWLEGGIVDGVATPDIESWVAALDELAQLDAVRIRAGRGEDVDVAEGVEAQKLYLREIDALVDAYLAGLGANIADLSDPAKSSAHYAELQRLAEEAFPDRALSYLVGYGIYGLVNSKL